MRWLASGEGIAVNTDQVTAPLACSTPMTVGPLGSPVAMQRDAG